MTQVGQRSLPTAERVQAMKEPLHFIVATAGHVDHGKSALIQTACQRKKRAASPLISVLLT
jgi:GTPase